jgi:hypothetical protein
MDLRARPTARPEQDSEQHDNFTMTNRAPALASRAIG